MEQKKTVWNGDGSGVQTDVRYAVLHQVLCEQDQSNRCSKDGFLNFKTSKYKLHFFETASRLKFVLNTDLSVVTARDVLQDIYKNIYVEYVVKNPVCDLSQPIESDLFKSKLDEYIRALPIFSAKIS